MVACRDGWSSLPLYGKGDDQAQEAEENHITHEDGKKKRQSDKQFA
jgi:hypothetical protein